MGSRGRVPLLVSQPWAEIGELIAAMVPPSSPAPRQPFPVRFPHGAQPVLGVGVPRSPSAVAWGLPVPRGLCFGKGG